MYIIIIVTHGSRARSLSLLSADAAYGVQMTSRPAAESVPYDPNTSSDRVNGGGRGVAPTRRTRRLRAAVFRPTSTLTLREKKKNTTLGVPIINNSCRRARPSSPARRSAKRAAPHFFIFVVAPASGRRAGVSRSRAPARRAPRTRLGNPYVIFVCVLTRGGGGGDGDSIATAQYRYNSRRLTLWTTFCRRAMCDSSLSELCP